MSRSEPIFAAEYHRIIKPYCSNLRKCFDLKKQQQIPSIVFEGAWSCIPSSYFFGQIVGI